jgi:hypothetical protein
LSLSSCFFFDVVSALYRLTIQGIQGFLLSIPNSWKDVFLQEKLQQERAMWAVTWWSDERPFDFAIDSNWLKSA